MGVQYAYLGDCVKTVGTVLPDAGAGLLHIGRVATALWSQTLSRRQEERSMAWVQQYVWWWFALLATLIAVVGVVELASGAPIVTLDTVQALTGMTNLELAAKSSEAYQLIEFNVRVEGVHLIWVGALMGAIVGCGLRQDRRWAWWTMWSFPIYTVSLLVLNIIVKTAPGQSPAAQAFTGAIVGVLSAVILLVSAPRLFPRPSRS
jgi:energy-converting hydrogenase Eha subunit A